MLFLRTQQLAARIHSAGFKSTDVLLAREGRKEDRDPILMKLLREGGVWEPFMHRSRSRHDDPTLVNSDPANDHWHEPRFGPLMTELLKRERASALDI